MNRLSISLLLTFFLGSWLSNISIISTTKTLLEGSSLELILAVSSLSGLCFFVLLRFLNTFKKSNFASLMIMPIWVMLESLIFFIPHMPVWSALTALLFGELVKWHAYSVVLQRFGPLRAGQVLSWAVLAYEVGTITAAYTYQWSESWMLYPVKFLAVAIIYIPLFLRSGDETKSFQNTSQHKTPAGVLPWLIFMGVTAGFLKVSADTGFKFAVSTHAYDVGELVSQFYLMSAAFTLGLGAMKKIKWLAPRLSMPQTSLIMTAFSQLMFAVALFSGQTYFFVAMASMSRSVDKIFYQPTMQLLTSGFSLSTQEFLRRWHVNAFLAIGSMLGLLAFMGHGLLGSSQNVIWGMSALHFVVALGCFFVAAKFFRKIIMGLDSETKRSGITGGSRAMALLALLSPRHFLVHALIWSNKQGSSELLPPELITGLTAETGGEVIQSFYGMYEELSESHQLALIRLATILNRQRDRDFLLLIALEKINCGRRPRRLAALNLVKIHGTRYRPLLRRSRGKKSPLILKKKLA
jgi:hypothetical protein